MAMGDKLVTFDMAKELHDKIGEDVEELKGDYESFLSMLTPYREAEMISTRTYSGGDWILVGDKLYRVIVSTLNPGMTLTDSRVEEISINACLRGAGVASGVCATAEGRGTIASDWDAHAEGYQTNASGKRSHAEGLSSTASGEAAHAEGRSTNATGSDAHAEGQLTTASGNNSHAEGNSTTASKSSAHSEGASTTASNTASHAEGYETEASGYAAHAEGKATVASGLYSHAEGDTTKATGHYSHAEGSGTIANHASQHVFGEFNVPDESTANASNRGTYVEIVGNGSRASAQSNARTLDWNGNESLQGSLTLGKGTADETTITAAQLKALLALLT